MKNSDKCCTSDSVDTMLAGLTAPNPDVDSFELDKVNIEDDSYHDFVSHQIFFPEESPYQLIALWPSDTWVIINNEEFNEESNGEPTIDDILRDYDLNSSQILLVKEVLNIYLSVMSFEGYDIDKFNILTTMSNGFDNNTVSLRHYRNLYLPYLRDHFILVGLPVILEKILELKTPLDQLTKKGLRTWFEYLVDHIPDHLTPINVHYAHDTHPYITIHGISIGAGGSGKFYIPQVKWDAAITHFDYFVYGEFGKPLIDENDRIYKNMRGRPINFGFNIVYRQKWSHTGNQLSQPLKTIPLGPGQKETFTVNITRKDKATRAVSSLDSKEYTTETTSSVKDSSDIVNEASNIFNWKVDQKMEGGVDMKIWNAGGSTDISLSEQSKNLSKSTKNKIAESMEKASSKIRRETKIDITRESEVTSSFAQKSELSNPNDEIAITYLYQTLQRQYSINTYLSEVIPIIYVPRSIPYSTDIDLAFIRRQVNQIEEALLDTSYLELIRIIRTTSDDNIYSDASDDTSTNPLSDSLSNASLCIAGIPSGSEGITYSNTFDTLYGEYARLFEQQEQRKRDQLNIQRQIVNFRVHLIDNLLHYMQAIWASEDTTKRSLRLKRTTVNIDFQFEINDGPSQPLNTGINLKEGTWTQGMDTSNNVPVADIIEGDSPIGYHENYEIYRLQTNPSSIGLRELYAYHRIQFSTPPKINHTPEIDGINVFLATYRPHKLIYGHFYYRFHEINGEKRIYFYRRTLEGFEVIIDRINYVEGDMEVLEGEIFYMVFLSGAFANGYQRSFYVEPPLLEDPEIKIVKQEHTLPPIFSDMEHKLFTDELLNKMFKMLPGLEGYIESFFGDIPDKNIYDTLMQHRNEDSNSIRTMSVIREHYHEYLLRKKYHRFLVVDTQNIVLNLHVGSGSALENYKRIARYYDILKDITEVERRKLLLDNGIYSEPDPDTYIQVNGEEPSSLHSILSKAEQKPNVQDK